MRVGFAGTPDFAARALVAVHASGHTIPIVLTQPDRPSGRGMTLQTSPVKRYALAHGLPVGQPTSLRDADARAALLGIPLDVLVVAAYGLILPRAVLDWPRHGCLNVHALHADRRLQPHRSSNQGDPGPGLCRSRGDRKALPARRPIGDHPHGVDRLMRWPGGDEDVAPFEAHARRSES